MEVHGARGSSKAMGSVSVTLASYFARNIETESTDAWKLNSIKAKLIEAGFDDVLSVKQYRVRLRERPCVNVEQKFTDKGSFYNLS